MTTHSFNIPTDRQVYSQLLDILGLTPEMEPIDVESSVCLVCQPARNENPGKLGFAFGAGLGHFRNGTRAITRFFGRSDVKATALTAHWAVWTAAVVLGMSMATSTTAVVLTLLIYFYLTKVLFDAMMSI